MLNDNGLEEPKGIAFFNVKSGETHYAKLEPTIQAYINSSDMGINASRGQDFGWKLAADWVKRVRAFRRDTMQMSILTARNGGQKPTTVQVLYHLYGEEVRAYEEELEEHEAPFEEEYQRSISGKGAAPSVNEPTSALPAEDEEDDIADLIDNELDTDEEEADDPIAKAKAEKDAADAAELAQMEADEKAEKAKTAKAAKPKQN